MLYILGVIYLDQVTAMVWTTIHAWSLVDILLVHIFQFITYQANQFVHTEIDL